LRGGDEAGAALPVGGATGAAAPPASLSLSLGVNKKARPPLRHTTKNNSSETIDTPFSLRWSTRN
jgi:hypothetical protein